MIIKNISTQRLYIATHVISEVFFVIFSYVFFILEHNLVYIFYINLSFAIIDFFQATLPSRGKTEIVHLVTAYVSWCCYLTGGILALIAIDIAEPYKLIATLLLIPILGMFIYMHINRSKLYPYQLLIVPLFVLYMLLIVIGSS